MFVPGSNSSAGGTSILLEEVQEGIGRGEGMGVVAPLFTGTNQ